MGDHRTLAAAMRRHMASELRRPRTSIPATPAAVLDALGGSYTEGPLVRYSGGGGCTQHLHGANGMEVRLSDGPGRTATAELYGLDPMGPAALMSALRESVERENSRQEAAR